MHYTKPLNIIYIIHYGNKLRTNNKCCAPNFILQKNDCFKIINGDNSNSTWGINKHNNVIYNSENVQFTKHKYTNTYHLNFDSENINVVETCLFKIN